MAAIIIDGYNLIGTAHRDLAHQRDALVARLVAYRKLRGHDLTVVFDGWKSGGGRESAANVGGVKVIYSRLGDTADTVIKRIISSERSARPYPDPPGGIADSPYSKIRPTQEEVPAWKETCPRAP